MPGSTSAGASWSLPAVDLLDLSRFTPEQREVILAPDGPHLVLAGPGSGKTTVIAARIAYMVLGRGLAPASILALVFTRTAASQLRGRLASLLQQQARELDVATFHSLGLRIVRHWSRALGYDERQLAVCSEAEAREALDGLIQRLGIDLRDRTVADILPAIEHYRLDGEIDSDAVGQLGREFEQWLARRNAVDFTAMLAQPLRLFRQHPEALRVLQNAYRCILADEFQDVSGPQYTLLQGFATEHRNVTVVGDPCQNLYSWRGAGPRVVQRFRDDFADAAVHPLNKNFRSVQRILDLANAVGESLPDRVPLWSDNPSGLAPVLFIAEDETDEAEFAAAEIARLLDAGLIEHPGQAAVLYRTNSQAQALILALRSRQLPYLVRGGDDLFARREVRMVLAYLRLADNPLDAVALAHIANVPPRQLEKVAAVLRIEPRPASELTQVAEPYGDAAVESARQLVELLAELASERTWLGPAALFNRVLGLTGYADWLATRPNAEAALDSLRRLRQVLDALESDLSTWLAEVQLGEDLEWQAGQTERVTLTTIHRAKGDEWPAVFVAGFEDGLLPHVRALLDDPPAPEALREELRLAYVAVTRARERLYLSYCRQRLRDGQPHSRRPSRFLTQVPADLIRRAA